MDSLEYYISVKSGWVWWTGHVGRIEVVNDADSFFGGGGNFPEIGHCEDCDGAKSVVIRSTCFICYLRTKQLYCVG